MGSSSGLHKLGKIGYTVAADWGGSEGTIKCIIFQLIKILKNRMKLVMCLLKRKLNSPKRKVIPEL